MSQLRGRFSAPWFALLAYGVLVHALLAVALAKPDWLLRWRNQLLGRSSEVPAWYGDLHGFYQRQDLQLPAGRLVFIGDSHVQSLAVTLLSADAVNWGIGGDTSAALRQRAHYHRLADARAIVLVIGSNDLSLRDDAAIIANVQALLQQWAPIPVLLSTVLPVDDRSNPRLQALPSRLASLAPAYAAVCQQFPHCRLLDSYHLFADREGRLPAIWHEGDGIHLNAMGNARWRQAIAAALASLPVAPTP